MWIDRNDVPGSVGNEIPSTITAILTLGYANGHSVVILQSESAWPEVHPHVATSIRATLLSVIAGPPFCYVLYSSLGLLAALRVSTDQRLPSSTH